MQSDKGVDSENGEFISKIVEHLLSNNPEEFYTSGQWMTEKKGGSDVNRATST